MSPDQIKAFRLRARAKGFSEAQINAEIARKQQEEARTQLQRPQGVGQTMSAQNTEMPTSLTPTTQKRTLGGLAKNAVQDVVDWTVNTPIQTGKSLLGVGFEGARTVTSGIDRNRVAKKQKELEAATRAFKSEKDPVKQKALVAKSRLISKELEQLSGNLKQNDKANPFVKPEELPSSMGEFGKGILKNLGATFGLTTDETGRVVFDFETAIQSAYEKPVTTALIAKDLGTGIKRKVAKGTTKAVSEDLTKTATKEAGRIEKAGQGLREGVLNPQAEATPFYAERVTELQTAQKKLGLKGSARVQLEQLPKLFKKADTEIKDLLGKAENIKPGTLSEEFLKQIDDANYTLDDLQFSKAVEGEMKILNELDGKSPLIHYETLGKYRQLLKSTMKKVENGTTLLPKEEARLATYNTLKASIDTVSPEVRTLNNLQNSMYNISKGLVKSKGKKSALGVGKFRLPTGIGQTIQDRVGGTLEKSQMLPDSPMVGGVGISSIPKNISGIANSPGKFSIGLGLAKASGVQPLQEQTQGYEEQPGDYGQYDEYNQEGFQTNGDQIAESIPSHPIFGKSSKEEVLLDAFKKGANQKQLDEIEAIYKRFAPVGGDVNKETMGIANDLRKEYISETKNNNFREVTNAYKKVTSAPDTPAGDVSLVFAYMKMLDPSSVVREGEFATAENTAGIPERVMNAYNKALRGKRLGEDQRAGFIDAATAAYEGYQSSQEAIDQQYEDLARRYGIDPTLLGVGTIQASIPSVKKN